MDVDEVDLSDSTLRISPQIQLTHPDSHPDTTKPTIGDKIESNLITRKFHTTNLSDH